MNNTKNSANNSTIARLLSIALLATGLAMGAVGCAENTGNAPLGHELLDQDGNVVLDQNGEVIHLDQPATRVETTSQGLKPCSPRDPRC